MTSHPLFRHADAKSLPFSGAAETLDARMLSTTPLGGDKEHAPDNIAEMIVGVPRSPDSAPFYRILEHCMNGIAAAQLRIAELESASPTRRTLTHTRDK